MSTHTYEGQRMADAEVAAPVIKVASAWTVAGASSLADNGYAVAQTQVPWVFSLVGATTWQEFASTIASILAACYTLLLITEWFWVKFWRPILEHKGFLMPKAAKRKKRLPGPKK